VKVLHILTHDTGGGAAIACVRLHNNLLRNGVNSEILCHRTSGKVQRSFNTYSRSSWLFQRLLRYAIHIGCKLQFDPTAHYLSLNCFSNDLVKQIDHHQPDIVHLHWVGNGMLRVEDLPEITSRYPVVWTLHDMWPFCGAEHCVLEGYRWRDGYYNANRPSNARGVDLNRWVWQRKVKSWSGCTIHTIAVSAWMDQCVRTSRLFRDIMGDRAIIHNGIDTKLFAPSNLKQEHRLSNPSNAKPWRIAFGALNQKNRIKGQNYLISALMELQKQNIPFELISFGSGVVEIDNNIPKTNWGRIDNPQDLAKIYSDADIVVVPSILESFGLTAAEAMACGTPIVCFDTSGLRDIVMHKHTGYRARCYDHSDLAAGIKWCLGDKSLHLRISEAARAYAASHFDHEIITNQTIAFYQAIQKS